MTRKRRSELKRAGREERVERIRRNSLEVYRPGLSSSAVRELAIDDTVGAAILGVLGAACGAGAGAAVLGGWSPACAGILILGAMALLVLALHCWRNARDEWRLHRAISKRENWRG